MAQDVMLGSLDVKAVGLALNRPIDIRLDQLWAIARASGQPTTRQEIVAALILDADPRPISLGKLLNRYRTTAVGQVPVAGMPTIGSNLPKRPGRRRFREVGAKDANGSD
jgi:hypothetical protein